jgi:hypothetical protein
VLDHICYTDKSPGASVARRHSTFDILKDSSNQLLWVKSGATPMVHEAFNDAHCDRALFTFLDSLLDYKRLDQSDSDTIMRIMMILTGLWQRLSGRKLDPRLSHCLELISYFWSTISRFTGIWLESKTSNFKHLIATAAHEHPYLNQRQFILTRREKAHSRSKWWDMCHMCHSNLTRTNPRDIRSASSDAKRQIEAFEECLNWSHILVHSLS